MAPEKLSGAHVAYLSADKLPPKGGKDILAKIRKATPAETCLAGSRGGSHHQ